MVSIEGNGKSGGSRESEGWIRTVTSYRRFEERIVGWAQKYGHFLLRISFGVIFIWFGLPKVLGTSPTAQLIGGVVSIFPPEVFVVVLGVVQVAIGGGFLFRPLLPIALLLFFIHLPGTMLPLVLLPEQTFTRFPFSPTIEGQFCLKNLVLACAAIVVLGTLRPRTQGRAGSGSNARMR
jgi:uncharacterized membrane protein YkgB